MAKCTVMLRWMKKFVWLHSLIRRLKGQANLLVMPTLDSANISFNLLKVAAGDNLTIGPILLGACQTGEYPDTNGNGAPYRQYDGVNGG
jgi:hypothetical protein